VIVGYARVSTDKAEQDISIDAQVQQLLSAGCERVIRERGTAYREDARRPGWEELQALVAAGQCREVVAISQSRLSRRGDELPFLRMCARRGVTVRFLDGTPSDLADPAGRLLTGVLSTVNEVDSMIKSINVRNGLKRRKAEGHYACGRVPFGYIYDGSQVAPHPKDYKAARKLWDDLEANEFMLGRTIRQHRLDWSIPGLGRWVNNPILRGVVNNEADQVKALISWDEWHRARRLLDQRKVVHTRSPRTVRLLTGLVRCGCCNKRMHYIQAAGKPRLRCSNSCCNWYARGLAEWKIRNQLVDALRDAAQQMGPVAASLALPVIDQQQQQRQQQLEQLRALQDQGVAGLEDSIERLERSLITTPPESGPDWRSLFELFSSPNAFDAAADEILRVLALEYIAETIYIGDPTRVEIRIRQG
jgi:DNA invertase Pin-like site-specific DNA recombinase